MVNEEILELDHMTLQELYEKLAVTIYECQIEQQKLPAGTIETFEQIKYGTKKLHFSLIRYLRWARGKTGYIKERDKSGLIQVGKKVYKIEDWEEALLEIKTKIKYYLRKILDNEDKPTKSMRET